MHLVAERANRLGAGHAAPEEACQPVPLCQLVSALRINLKRPLIDRQTYKTRCSAALAEWQNLMA